MKWCMLTRTQRFLSAFLFIPIVIAACSGGGVDSGSATAQAGGNGKKSFDPPEVTNGERLFIETRFAQAFKAFLDNGGNVNDPNAGDPIVDSVETLGIPISNEAPFKGLSINCRSCHMVDDVLTAPGGGMRTYADFARRSPIPSRADGKAHAPRNSPPLVNASLARPGGALFHFDAEFPTLTDLTAATFTGRNFGWLPGEKAQAIAHIARIVREDDGSGALAQEFGGLSLTDMLTGSGPAISKEFRLPPAFRVNVARASDEEIVAGVVRLVAAYVEQLIFSQDDAGNFNLSPFDVFRSRNGLPRRPADNESPIDYSRRLRTLLNAPGFSPQFVRSNPNRLDGQFQFHSQAFEFGPAQLAGLKIFLAEPAALPASPAELAAGKIGNCIACHAAPNFTDFKLHNTGTTQKEYDALHGGGAFSALAIPNLAARNGHYDAFLPATAIHPNASERFRAIPILADPTLTDLGVWNVFANPDMPASQMKIRTILCDDRQSCLVPDATLLDRAIARFKTPGLRDLSHSAPYMHNGQFDTLDDIIAFYRDSSALARAGTLRNGALQLQGIALQAGDDASLVAFLKSLNEDYQ